MLARADAPPKCTASVQIDGTVFSLDLPTAGSPDDIAELAAAYSRALPLASMRGANCENETDPLACLEKRVQLSILVAHAQCASRAFAAQAPSAPRRRGDQLVLCQLAGGVTNQEMQVENCVQLARLLGATLVVPRPKPAATTFIAGLDAPDAPFSRLWDPEAFATYSEEMGVRLVDAASLGESELRPTIRAHLDRVRWVSGRGPALWNLTRLRDDGSVAASLTVEPPSLHPERRVATDALLFALLGAEPVVLAVAPFMTFSASLGTRCCVAAPSLRARADAVRNGLPSAFDCLHARIEEDWSQRTSCLDGFAWTCSKDPADAGQTFEDPANEIVAALRRLEPPVPPGRTLYVATGASESQLRPLFSLFDVRTRPQTTDDEAHFMSYSDALVDRLVCEEADRFFGTDGSTFSLKITKLRNETREEAAGRDAPGVPSDGTDGTGDVMLTL